VEQPGGDVKLARHPALQNVEFASVWNSCRIFGGEQIFFEIKSRLVRRISTRVFEPSLLPAALPFLRPVRRPEMRRSFEPSPADILRACRDIQRTWSANDELRRRGAVDQDWKPPDTDPAVQNPDDVPAEE
jgi:hypothetical protein